MHIDADSQAHQSRLESVRQVDSSDRSEAGITSEPVRFESAIVNRRRTLWAAALVLLACGLLWFNLADTRSTSAAVNSYRDWEIVRLTQSGGSFFPDISRDGKYVAYVSEESGQQAVWILQLATSTRQQIVAPRKFDYRDLLFTPDGSQLYFSRAEGPSPLRSLYRIPVLGGVARKLRDDIDSSIALSPDGAHLALSRRNSEGESEFVVASADGVEERVLAERGLLEFPAWSPDGKVIAFSLGHAGSGGPNMSIHEILLADGARKEISPRKWNFVGKKTWLPDGSGLIVSGRGQDSKVSQLWLVAYPSGDARPLSDNLDGFRQARLTADARMLVADQVAAVSDIWSSPLADAAGARRVGVWGMSGLHLLRDGRIAYASWQSGGDVKIWMMNGDGTEKKQLTTDGGFDASVVGSPDGRYLFFNSSRSGHHEIWRMNLDGTGLVRVTHTNGAHAPSVSPDGRWLIYLATGDDFLYKVPLEGGAPVKVAGEAVGVSAVSPDGKLIAYIATGKNTWAIAVSSFDDGSAIRRFEIGSNSLNNNSLKWTPDGKALLYAASSDAVGNIWMQPLDGSTPRQVTNFKEDGIFRFDISPDGKTLICARGAWRSDILLIKNLR